MSTILLHAGSATLTISSEAGGQLSLERDGKALLAPSPPLHLVVDGATHTAWRDVELVGTAEKAIIRGVVADGLTAELQIVAPIGDAAFEFTLSVRNEGASPVTISSTDSLAIRLVPGDWQGLGFTSKWGEEYEPEPFALDAPRTLEVRTGRSSLGHSPWLGLSAGDHGAVVVAPVWSGNWHIVLTPHDGGIDLAAGLSPWKFAHELAPGASFEAPAVLLAAGPDLEEASLALTRAVGAALPRSPASEAVPLEWNHWWPYEDKDITADIFLANAGIATELGFAVSTLDAGWFGAADSDTFWWDIRGDFGEENRARFPGGVGHLADETRRRGQKFGIWMEIEAVGLKAAVRKERADIMARRDDDPPEAPLDPDDPGFLGYVCLGSGAGRAHVRALLEALVDKTGCEWIKVDFNLDPKAGCSCREHGHGPGDGLYAHYRGLYDLLDGFRAAHPEIIVEACASGGLRVDAGLLRHVHCAFLSDPDWTPHHLQVVHGTSRLLPPAAMLHWPMSEWRGKHPQQTLSLRDPALTEDVFDTIVRSAFMHRFGLSWRLPDLPRHLRQRLKAHLAIYAETIVPFVRNGDLRRLTDTPLRRGGGATTPAFQLSLGDRHIVLGFSLGPIDEGLGIRPTPGGFTLKPRALAADRSYQLRALSPDGVGPAEVRPGAQWMAEGVAPITVSSYVGILEPL